MIQLKHFWNKYSDRLGEFFRYSAGCGCNLLLKIAITTVLTRIGLAIWLGYLICQLLILMLSFCYHYFITFRRNFEGTVSLLKNFLKYTSLVLSLMLLNYLLVVGGIAYFGKLLFPDTLSDLAKDLFHAGIIISVSVFLFALRFFLYHYLFKKKDYRYYTGKNLNAVYLAHAADLSVARNAASGGVTTAILSGMLNRGEIDGVLAAVQTFSGDEPPQTATKIICSAAELRQAQGSIYYEFKYLTRELFEQLKSFRGKLAVVGLPCQLKAIQGIAEKNPKIREKIVIRIGLFCGHVSKKELFLKVLQKKGLKPEELSAFRFNRGPWRGQAEATLKTGETRRWPTAYYKLYQNLFISSEKKCFSCFDHYAEYADISCGDVWCQKYRFAKIKPSMAAVRTPAGREVWQRAVQSGDLIAEEKTEKALFDANARTVIFHKAIRARAAIFSKYGMKIAVPSEAAPARWNEKIAAAIIAHFYFADPDVMLKKNRKLLKFRLYLMKAFTSF